MSRLNRYVFRQLFWTAVLVAASLTCVVWLIQSLRFVEMIVNRGLSAAVFVYFTALLLPSFLSLIMPVALFIAVAFTYNRLTVDSELVAMRASGVSHRRLALPALALAAIATVAGYALSLYLVPVSYRAFKDLQNQIRDTYTSVLVQEGVFNSLTKDVTIYVRSRTSDGELIGIIVHDGRDRERPVTMMAERGAMVEGPRGPRVLMLNGNRQERTSATDRMSLFYFDRYVFEVGAFGPATQARWREPRERFVHELFKPHNEADDIAFNKLRMEAHSRLASPLLSLAAVFVAVACLLVGEFNRRGEFRRVALAIAIVVAMEAATLTVKSVGERVLELAPLLYLVALLPIVVAGAALLTDGRLRRPRPTLARQGAG